MRFTIASTLSLLLFACGFAGDGGTGDLGPGDPDGEGARRYAEMCESCHGEIGEGALGPPVAGFAGGDAARTRALTAIIEARMPVQSPAQCVGECAESVAAFIVHGLTPEALACDQVRPSPRRLRLLSRREYRNTIADLLAPLAEEASACGRHTDCGYRATCEASACVRSACGVHTFAFDPGGRTLERVHVAGELNGWAGTVAAGGWPMERDPASGLWTVTRSVPEGAHAYKFVLDESEWIADPRSPDTEADGHGGDNAVLVMRCDGGLDGLDPAAQLPPSTRPEGFPFDHNADAALVTAVHVDAHLAAAREVAAWARPRLDRLVPCDPGADRAGCADAYARALGRRAFRRPLEPAEVARYRALIEGEASFFDGAALALEAMLVAPSFLYRAELGHAQGDGTYVLDGYEIASALSYFLWGTMPDEALLDAAARGELDDAAGIEAQARRLLGDPRSRHAIEAFARQWLGIDELATLHRHAGLFPEFDDALKAAFERETSRFVSHVIFESSGSFEELLLADYSFVDERLASFYGVPGGVPAGLEKRLYGDGRRAGLLGHGSVLAATSHSDQTSPVRRGLFVRSRLLCQELPPPPPDIAGVPDVDPGATTRERFQQHSDDPACRSCHQYTDALGFGLENFDAVGRWRDTEHGRAIDPSGELNDVEGLGTRTSEPFSTLPALAEALADSHATRACFVRQTYRFARGARETLGNRCARLWLEERFAEAGWDVRELLVAITLSPDFVVRR